MANEQIYLWPCPGCSAEKYVPKNLSCGHILCEQCVNNNDNNLQCPECLEKTVPTTLGTNYPLLRFLDGEQKYNDIFKRPQNIVKGDNYNDDYYNYWQCDKHGGNPLTLFCQTCDIFVCNDCVIVNHPPLPRGGCQLAKLRDAIKKLKTEYLKKINQILSNVEQFNSETLQLTLAQHTFCLDHCRCPDTFEHCELLLKTSRLLQQFRLKIETWIRSVETRVEQLKLALTEKMSKPSSMLALITEILAYDREILTNIIEMRIRDYNLVNAAIKPHLKRVSLNIYLFRICKSLYCCCCKALSIGLE